MIAKRIVINCPGCEIELESGLLTGMMQCPYCDKKFNVEDGKKAHEILTQRQFIKEENINKTLKAKTETNNDVSGKAKYCGECGRKLVYDARFCDWCGTKL